MRIVKEIITGVISQNTFFTRLAEEVGENDSVSELLSALVSLTSPLCLQRDAYGHALMESQSGRLDIVLTDQLNYSPQHVNDLSTITLKKRGNLCRLN